MPLHFSPPNRDTDYQSYLVYILTWIWLLTNVSVISFGFIVKPENSLRWLTLICILIAIGGTCLFLNRRGHTKAASYALPILLYAYVTSGAFTAGGGRAPSLMTYVPLILTTGFLLGAKRGVAMSMLCLFTALVFVLAEIYGYMPAGVTFSPFARWVALLLPFSIVIAIQYYATNHLRQSLERLKTEMEEKLRIEVIKDRAIYDMGERMKELKLLYGGSQLLQNTERPLAEVMRDFAELLPYGWQYPEITAAQVRIGDHVFATSNFVVTTQRQSAETVTAQNTKCAIEVVYLQEKAVIDEGPFLKEERSLVNMLAEMLKVYLEQRETMEALQKSEANLQTILSTTETAYILVNDKLEIITRNAAADKFGLKEHGTTAQGGEKLSVFFRDENKPELNRMMEDVARGKHINYETRYEDTNGAANYYHINMSPVLSGQNSYKGFLLAINDITEIKNAQNEIKALNESLEQKVEERTQELTDANRELEAFSYTVSHDLQAPLRVINGYGNLLLRTQAEKLDGEGREFLHVINDKVNQMSQLIKDLLEFSRFGKTPLNRREVDMNEMVQVVVDEVRLINYSSKTRISVGDLPVVNCDVALMRQVWGNLVGNAVKYSAKKDEPNVEIGTEQRGEALVYYVKDNGAGFDMQYADKLFKVFKRLHTNDEFEGTGVGLATVERIISKHGGKIWVYAKPDEGATFYFTLS